MMMRKEAMEKYERAKKEGKVDFDIISLLDKLNSTQHFYTTSSCSGRIVLLNIPEIGDKKEAKFLGKWHNVVEIREVKKSIENYKENYLFLLMQSPIIHIVANSLENARKIIKIALECGFKYTTIKNIEDHRVLVEILSTENLHIPIGEEGIVKINDETLEFFVKFANKMLRRSKEKLKCLENKISYFLLSFS